MTTKAMSLEVRSAQAESPSTRYGGQRCDPELGRDIEADDIKNLTAFLFRSPNKNSITASAKKHPKRLSITSSHWFRLPVPGNVHRYTKPFT